MNHWGRRIINNSQVRTFKKGECPVGRLQVKGTCWFQSIVNGWILSTESRKIMKRKLEAFKQSNEMKKYTNIQACPMRGKLPVYFWSYVEYMINAIEGKSKNTSNFHVNVMKNKQFSSNNLIQNVYKWNKGNTEGGSTKNLKMFLELLFPGNWSEDIGKDIYLKAFSDDDDITAPNGYKICHAYISVYSGNSTGHAITGGLCGKIPFIFDSNIPDIDYNRNWLESMWWKIYISIVAHRYDFNYNTLNGKRYVIFVKNKPSSNFYKPPTSINKVNKTNSRITSLRNIRSLTNKLTTFNYNYLSKYGLGAYSNKKVDELRSKMTPEQVISSGILGAYSVAKLQRITGNTTNNHAKLYYAAVNKLRPTIRKPTIRNKVKNLFASKKKTLGKIFRRKKI